MRMWRVIRVLLDNILRNIYTSLVVTGQEVPEPLTRRVMPEYIRCVLHSTYRDTRDFIMLRTIRQVAMEMQEARG